MINNKKVQQMIKRLFDVTVAFIGIVVFLPIWCVVACFIKLTSPGSVLFLQDRPGKGGVIFKIYKFRTMRLGSEKMIKGQEVFKDDERITSVGKFLRRTKIDEVPQLLNVLKGDMSLVGPRPERIASLKEYDDTTKKRLNVRPGLTGLAQVSGNIYLELHKRYEYDVWYVENFSIIMDIRILLRTVGVVILGEERYAHKNLVGEKDYANTLK